MSRQASSDSRTRWAGGWPVATSPLGASWPASPGEAAEGAGDTPRARPLLRLGVGRRLPALLVVAATAAPLLPALLCLLDLPLNDALVEGAVAEGDRLCMEDASGLGSNRVGRRQDAVLELRCGGAVELCEDVVPRRAELGQLVVEDPAAEEHALEGGLVLVPRRRGKLN